MSANDFSEKLRNLRAKHNLTLEQVAQHVGVGKSTVRKWETGMIENLRRDKIAKLAEVLHTTPAYLMGWSTPSSLADQAGYWDGDRLKEERNSRGYTISYISSKLEITEEDYKRLESGLSEPSFKLLLSMSDLFGFDLDYICHRMTNTNSFTPSFNLSDSEMNFIKKYRRLDPRGQAAVLNVLEFEYASLPGENTHTVAKEA